MPWWLLSILILVAIWIVALALLYAAGRRLAAKELATLLPNLLILFRGLLKDKRVPRGSKALLAIAIVWVVSPIDLIPEFLPVIGPLDDAVMAALVLRHVIRRAGRDVVAEHWRGEPATLEVLLRVAGVTRAG